MQAVKELKPMTVIAAIVGLDKVKPVSFGINFLLRAAQATRCEPFLA